MQKKLARWHTRFFNRWIYSQLKSSWTSESRASTILFQAREGVPSGCNNGRVYLQLYGLDPTKIGSDNRVARGWIRELIRFELHCKQSTRAVREYLRWNAPHRLCISNFRSLKSASLGYYHRVRLKRPRIMSAFRGNQVADRNKMTQEPFCLIYAWWKGFMLLYP